MTGTQHESGEVRSIYGPHLRAATLGILILITLAAFEGIGVAAALPTAARELHGLGAYGWAFTGFLVANVVGLVLSGQISDQRGPRLPLVAGIGGFLGGLTVSGTATTMTQLVAGRVVQGVGSGLLITAVYVILGERYPERLRPKIFAAMSSAWVVPSLVGPAIAGALSQHASWRWVFLGLIPFVLIGAGSMALALRGAVGGSREPGRTSRSGRVLRALAVAAGVAALEAAGQHAGGLVMLLAIPGLAGLIWGLRGLLPPGTIRVRPGVAAPIALRGLIAGAFFGVDATIPLSLTVQHHFSPTAAGLPLTMSGVAWALGSWWQGRNPSADRVDLLRSGFACVAGGCLLAGVVSLPGVPGMLMYLAWALAGIGAGLAISSCGVLVLAFTSDERRGADTAALQVADVVLSAITTGVAGVLLAAAARGVLGYTVAFVAFDAGMAVLAAVGVTVAGRAGPPAAARPPRAGRATATVS